MKSAILSFCVWTASAYGLYYGSPNLPNTTQEGIIIPKESWFGLKVGYQNDYVIDKSLKVASRQSAHRIEVFNYYLQQGVMTLNFIDRFEAYGLLGAMKFHIEPRNSDTVRQVYQTNNHFSWGFGARGIIFEWGRAVLGLDFKYLGSSPSLNSISHNGIPRESGSAYLRYREWQIGLGLAFALETFSPYIGAIYNQSTGHYKDLPTDLLPSHKHHFSVISRKKFGMAVGATLSTGKIFDIDLEARMINETALSAAANVKF